MHTNQVITMMSIDIYIWHLVIMRQERFKDAYIIMWNITAIYDCRVAHATRCMKHNGHQNHLCSTDDSNNFETLSNGHTSYIPMHTSTWRCVGHVLDEHQYVGACNRHMRTWPWWYLIYENVQEVKRLWLFISLLKLVYNFHFYTFFIHFLQPISARALCIGHCASAPNDQIGYHLKLPRKTLKKSLWSDNHNKTRNV